MSKTVGQIGLNLKVNDKDFKQQMNSIQNMAKSVAKTLVAAFAVKKLIDFGAQAIKLGSDLAEVQNVVDVAFPKMSKQIDEFAKNAMYASGLSETMAKRYVGTFGAMAKAFGFSEKEAYDMSTALTSLAGDVASFYNLNQDDAYTKLKSVFTGETETLKDLGVVMTQTALDAYAMSNGFGKTTQQMSEAEKVALRFAFVTDQLSLASGDFARTSDGWANQVRIMKLQFESFMASVGQGLINIFTPVIKVINFLLSKLLTVGNAFRALTELFTGKKSVQGSGIQETADAVGDMSDSFEGAADGADSVGKAADDAGKSARKAAKEMKSLMGFDQINKLAEQPASGDAGGGSSGAGGGGGTPKGAKVDMGKIAEGGNQVEGMLDGLFRRLIELVDLFNKGFESAFRVEGIERVKKGLEQIASILQDIFTDSGVVSSFNTMLDKIAYALGQFAGSVGTVGLSIAVFLVESIANGLANQKENIKSALVALFENTGDIFKAGGNIAKVVSSAIYDVLTSEGAIRIGSAITSAFLSLGSTAVEIGSKFGGDLLKGLEKIITENAPSFTETFKNTLNAIAPAFETIKQFIDDFGTTCKRVYDEHVRPFIESLSSGFSEIVGSVIKTFDEQVNPIIENFGKGLKDVYDNHIKPALDTTGEAFGAVIDTLKELWENVGKPFVKWIASTAVGNIGKLAKTFGGVLLEALKLLANFWKGLMDIVKDFSKWCSNNKPIVEALATAIGLVAIAWEGIKFASWAEQAGGIPKLIENISGKFDGLISTLKGLTVDKLKDWAENAKLTVTYAKDFVVNSAAYLIEIGKQGIAWVTSTASLVAHTVAQTAATAATWALNAAMAVLKSHITLVVAAIGALVAIGYLLVTNWETVSQVASSVWQTICDFIGGICQSIGQFFSGLWSGIQETFSGVDKWFVDIFKSAWDGIVSVFTGLGSWFGDRWNDVTRALGSVGRWFSDMFKGAWDGIVSVFSGAGKWFESIWNSIKRVFDNVSSFFGNIFKGAWEIITGIFSTIPKWFSDIFSKAWAGVRDVFSTGGRIFAGIVDGIAGTFKRVVNAIIGGINNVIAVPFNAINSALDGIRGVNIMGFSPFDWLPNIGVPKIPMLAQGGFVRANTPQLAMIGDNKHYGEIVAPENKMIEMAKTAAELVKSGKHDMEIIVLLRELIVAVRALDLTIDGDSLTKRIFDTANEIQRRTNQPLLEY